MASTTTPGELERLVRRTLNRTKGSGVMLTTKLMMDMLFSEEGQDAYEQERLRRIHGDG
jgi:hypothetical protein